MFAFVRQARIFDEWFTESAAAIGHNANDWVTAEEMVSDYATLGFKFNGKPAAEPGKIGQVVLYAGVPKGTLFRISAI